MVVQVRALACEWPAVRGLPLSRLSTADVAREARRCGLVATISDTTVWRWLHEDAIRPWQHRCWIFPRDPDFEAKAGRILDLYAGTWDGRGLKDDEFVLSADEKTSIQARRRKHPSLPPRPGEPARSNTSTPDVVPGRIWPPSTSTARSSSAAANAPPASYRSIASSTR